MRLLDPKIFTGRIVCKSGLKIGGTVDTSGIGETDNPVIRHPITRLPYIPGSSLKGRMRALLELKHDRVYVTEARDGSKSGHPCTCGTCFVCKLFGCGDIKKTRDPSRLIFCDAQLTADSRAKLEEKLPSMFVEIKTEIAMDRLKGVTQNGSLREQERVPAETEFEYKIVMRLFDTDTPDMVKEYCARLQEGFQLLMENHIGGNVSRGYGEIEIIPDTPK